MKGMRVEPRRSPRAGGPWLQTSGSCLNGRHVDGLGRLIVGSRDLHLLPGELSRFLLIVELVDSLLRGVVQDVLPAHLDAVFSTHLPSHRSIWIHLSMAFFLQHHCVRAIFRTLTVHDFATEGLILRRRETRHQQCAYSKTPHELLHLFPP